MKSLLIHANMSLIAFVDILLVGLVAPLVTYFFDDIIQKGMIFEFWGNYLTKNPKWILKPLGGCMKCTNVWIAIFMLFFYYFIPSIFIILGVVSLANFIQTKLWT